MNSTHLQAVALASILVSCASTKPVEKGPAAHPCALIMTDDDIPSGSATAGALFIGEDDLGRRLLTSDVLSVTSGLRDAGYTCVVVADSHERALDHDRLVDSGVRVVTPVKEKSWRWPFFGVSGLEYKIAALVGFHARGGAKGFRQHTVNDAVKRMSIDGLETGEVGMSILGLFAAGMMPVLVVGDEGAVAEAHFFAPAAVAVAVRWHDKDGGVRFLSENQARVVLRKAAREAASYPSAPRLWRYPLALGVDARRPSAAKSAAAKAGTLLVEARRVWGLEAAGLTFSPKVEGASVTWSARDGKAAYVSLVAVASSLQPEKHDVAWSWISKGFTAYRAGRHDEALAAYRKALELDASDFETRCRVGQVHLARGSIPDALREFGEGVQHLEELDPVFQSICQLGFARALERSGRSSEAASNFRRVLEIPDHDGSYIEARKAIERLSGVAPGR
jgi:D-aminopeptidase